MAVVILISGKAGSGKNTFARILHENLKNDFEVREAAFADAVKEIARNIFSWDGKKDLKGRTLLQNIGEGGRGYNKDIWVNILKKRIVEVQEQGKPLLFIITDCRYENEMSFLDDTDNKVIKVRMERNHNNGLTLEQSIHPSETSLDNYKHFHFKVNNNGSIEDLRKYVKEIKEVLDGNYSD